MANATSSDLVDWEFESPSRDHESDASGRRPRVNGPAAVQVRDGGDSVCTPRRNTPEHLLIARAGSRGLSPSTRRLRVRVPPGAHPVVQPEEQAPTAANTFGLSCIRGSAIRTGDRRLTLTIGRSPRKRSRVRLPALRCPEPMAQHARVVSRPTTITPEGGESR